MPPKAGADVLTPNAGFVVLAPNAGVDVLAPPNAGVDVFAPPNAGVVVFPPNEKFPNPVGFAGVLLARPVLPKLKDAMSSMHKIQNFNFLTYKH